MDEIGSLVKALIREKPEELLAANRKYLDFANLVLGVAGENYTKALHAVMVCAATVEAFPENLESVLHFVRGNRHHFKEFGKAEAFDQELSDLIEDKDEPKECAAVLIDSVYHKAYNLRVSDIYAQGGRIAAGAADNPSTKERGPSAAAEYIAEETSKLVVKGPAEVGGDLMDNLDYMESYIDSYIIGDSKRVYTGFKQVDETTLIGKKQRIRWIGILGYTHHGKSLLLMSMIYNMALHGANVMLCPRESSVEEAWMNIIWLHHSRVCPDRPIASREDWMRIGAEVGTEKYETIKMIEKDLRSGTSIPGKIVVFNCNSWEDIEDKLRTTNKKHRYDVLAVDYFGHLDPEGKKSESDIDKQKKALRKAQKLTLNGINNDQQGLVIITPLQANKKGYEEAAKREGDKYGLYESLTAVEWFTQAAQDMDCVMSVWHEGDSCTEVNPKQMILHCLKGRGNMRFRTHRLKIQPDTAYLSDITASDTPSMGGERTLDSLSTEDMDDVVYTKTKLDTDDWGI